MELASFILTLPDLWCDAAVLGQQYAHGEITQGQGADRMAALIETRHGENGLGGQGYSRIDDLAFVVLEFPVMTTGRLVGESPVGDLELALRGIFLK